MLGLYFRGRRRGHQAENGWKSNMTEGDVQDKKCAVAVGEEGREVVMCVVRGFGEVRGALLLFVFIQLSGLDFNLQSDWGPLKHLNVGSDVILIAFLQNYCGQDVKDERRMGETEDRKIKRQ